MPRIQPNRGRKAGMRPQMRVPAPRRDFDSLSRIFRTVLRNGAIGGAVGGAIVVGGCIGGDGTSSGEGGLGNMEEGGSGGSDTGGGSGGMGGSGGDDTGSGGDKGGGTGGDDTGGGSGGDDTGGGSGGGDTGGGTGGTTAGGGDEPECDGYQALLAHGLNPVESPTYTGFHSFSDGNVGIEHSVLDSVGTLCGDASDSGTCTTAAMMPAQDVVFNECGMIGCSANIIVTTDGDDVTQYGTMDELLAFLGDIDTPQEALLVARYAGYLIQCDGATTVTEVDGGYQVVVDNMNSCDSHYYRWTLLIRPDGSIEVVDEEDLGASMIACGRRPVGLLSDGRAATDSRVADYFAACVHLEGAAVHAFETMTLELLHHGAPRALVDAAQQSAAEERHHTALASVLCQRAQAPEPTPRLDDVVMRDLLAMARENVIEGCVRETFGALLAHYQAQHAQDPKVADAMRTIAQDETRHAALAWELERWIEPQLTVAERKHLDTIKRSAVAQLAREMAQPMPAELIRDAGLPPVEVAAAMLDRLRAELWA